MALRYRPYLWKFPRGSRRVRLYHRAFLASVKFCLPEWILPFLASRRQFSSYVLLEAVL